MRNSWITHRLRSALIRENSMIFVLRLLSESDLNEWEVLDGLQSRYGATPSAREFRQLRELLVSGGYVGVETVGTAPKLHITAVGMVLLHRLEEESRAILSGFDASPASALTR